jgi:REP element-mobilizing transposase RayT
MPQPYNPNQHHRRSIRLKGYDYRSAGSYFVTICTRQRECVLADPVVTGIITGVWQALPGWFPTIELDEFVAMPNHVHFIVWLGANVGARASLAPTGDAGVGATLAVAPDAVAPNGVGLNIGAGASPAPTNDVDAPPAWIIPSPETTNLNPTLGEVVGAFKSLVFTVYLDWVEANDPLRRAKFWQRNFYEHIIRNERELQAIRAYIRANPAQWALDRDNPANIRHLPPPAGIEEYLADIPDLADDET